MIKKLAALFLCAAIVVSALTGCGQQNDISSGAGQEDFPVTIGKVTIDAEPTGTAVLSANVADVILALGYEINLKAKSASCTQSDLAALPDVTADDADKIKAAGANLVFTDTALTQQQQDAMKKNGITVLTISPATSRSDLSRLYLEVGSALKGASTGYGKGKDIASGMWESIDDITREVPQQPTAVTAVYLYDLAGHAATGDTLAGTLITSSGLQNVADGATDGQYPISSLLLANPDYIFCAQGVKAQITASAELKNLDAVKQNRVYEMDPTMMTLQGEQMINAVSFMAGTAYPQMAQSTPSSAASSSPSSAGSSSSSAPSASSAANSIDTNQTLKSGMKSDDVLKMQNRLLELGYMFVKPSGLFASGTVQAVKDFQYLNGLPTTGIADPATLQKLYSSDAKKRNS
jgi:iron complex transport system substrate-binding protein